MNSALFLVRSSVTVHSNFGFFFGSGGIGVGLFRDIPITESHTYAVTFFLKLSVLQQCGRVFSRVVRPSKSLVNVGRENR